jgi:hypothetical protein
LLGVGVASSLGWGEVVAGGVCPWVIVGGGYGAVWVVVGHGEVVAVGEDERCVVCRVSRPERVLIL